MGIGKENYHKFPALLRAKLENGDILFPEEELRGIDYVLPDFDFLKKNEKKIKTLVITPLVVLNTTFILLSGAPKKELFIFILLFCWILLL